MKLPYLFLLFSVPTTLVVANMMPNPTPYFVTNAKGINQGPIYLRGSMSDSWEEDEEGFTVVSDESRSYFYAKQDETTGDLVATALPIRQKVNDVLIGLSPSQYGLSPHERQSEEARLRKCGDFCNKVGTRCSYKTMQYSFERLNTVLGSMFHS